MRSTKCVRIEIEILQLANQAINEIRRNYPEMYEQNSLIDISKVINKELEMVLNDPSITRNCLHKNHSGGCVGTMCNCGCSVNLPQCTNT